MSRFAALRVPVVGFLLAAYFACAPLAYANGRSTTPQGVRAELVALADLPIQGQQTYALIFQGGPFPYAKDGSVFGNRERRLPLHERGFYREYTVKTPGVKSRGARRIACGGQPRHPEVCYYSEDHYANFRRIDR
jgi:ribonuclease T1